MRTTKAVQPRMACLYLLLIKTAPNSCSTFYYPFLEVNLFLHHFPMAFFFFFFNGMVNVFKIHHSTVRQPKEANEWTKRGSLKSLNFPHSCTDNWNVTAKKHTKNNQTTTTKKCLLMQYSPQAQWHQVNDCNFMFCAPDHCHVSLCVEWSPKGSSPSNFFSCPHNFWIKLLYYCISS